MVSAVLFLSFGVSCLLAWLGKPFFVCHQHLWFVLSFFATGICGLFFLSLSQAFVYSFFLSRLFLPFVLDSVFALLVHNRRFPEITGKDNLTVFSYSGRVKSPEWRRQLRRADLRQF